MNEACHTCRTCTCACHYWKWVISLWRIQCVTNVVESRRTWCFISHIWGLMSHKWMSHVTHDLFHFVNKACQTCGSVMSHRWMSHVWMNHVTHLNESCHAWKWVMSHMGMRHITYDWLNRTRHESHDYIHGCARESLCAVMYMCVCMRARTHGCLRPSVCEREEGKEREIVGLAAETLKKVLFLHQCLAVCCRVSQCAF